MGVAVNVSLGYGGKKAAEDGLHDQAVHRDAALGMMGIVIHSASRAVASLKFAVLLYAISPRRPLAECSLGLCPCQSHGSL